MLDFQTVFPTVLATGRVQNHEDLNRRLVAEIGKVRADMPNGKPSAWACNVYTTFLNGADLHLKFPAFKRLARIMLAHAQAYADFMEVDASKVRPMITECWLNVYNRGDAQETHNHAGFHLSGVYYVRAPVGCGRINFYTPLIEDNFSQLPSIRPSWKTRSMTHVQPEDGTIVLFRSWLRHSVAPSDINEERISIAFNVLLAPIEAAERAARALEDRTAAPLPGLGG